MKVKVYTTTSCPYCQMLKEFLKQNGVTFEEGMVDQDVNALNEMMGISEGYLGVPFTLITRDDGTWEKVIGFDQAKFKTILGK